MGAEGSLAAALRLMIEAEGPITLEAFMALALGHPAFGYYMTRDPFGPAGDFVTAPEISQMFGELLGLWAVAVWTALGCPSPFRGVEFGPGRGTLMADALRATRRHTGFRAALDLNLIETSPVLRAAQRRTLGAEADAVTWHQDFETVPPGPVIVLANEFFDALPVRHYVRTASGWCERCIGLGQDRLAFGLKPWPDAALTLKAPEGSVIELGLAARRIAGDIAARIAAEGGAALIIDYGYEGPRLGETLQAVKAHRFVDPLEAPGEADLTTHVDFAALAAAGRAKGAMVWGPVPQRDFLLQLGIAERAASLKARADAAQAAAVDAAMRRLLDAGAAESPGMGQMFKVLAFTASGDIRPPGFCETASAKPYEGQR